MALVEAHVLHWSIGIVTFPFSPEDNLHTSYHTETDWHVVASQYVYIAHRMHVLTSKHGKNCHNL